MQCRPHSFAHKNFVVTPNSGLNGSHWIPHLYSTVCSKCSPALFWLPDMLKIPLHNESTPPTADDQIRRQTFSVHVQNLWDARVNRFTNGRLVSPQATPEPRHSATTVATRTAPFSYKSNPHLLVRCHISAISHKKCFFCFFPFYVILSSFACPSNGFINKLLSLTSLVPTQPAVFSWSHQLMNQRAFSSVAGSSNSITFLSKPKAHQNVGNEFHCFIRAYCVPAHKLICWVAIPNSLCCFYSKLRT